MHLISTKSLYLHIFVYSYTSCCCWAINNLNGLAVNHEEMLWPCATLSLNAICQKQFSYIYISATGSCGLIWSFTNRLLHPFSDMIRGTIMMVAWEWLITGTTNDQPLGKMILAASSDQYTDTSDRQRRKL